VEQVAEVVRRSLAEGERPVVGRVIDLKGFSTLPVDELVAIDGKGRFYGELLGRRGAEALGAAARDLPGGGLATVAVEIHGPEVKELGLACGGRADVLLQPASHIPERLWALLAERSPAALVTVIDGPAASPSALAVDRDGRSWGMLASGASALAGRLVDEARALIGEGRNAKRRVETDAGVALVEAWVPTPRLVVVGSGEMVGAIDAQARLLGWETAATESVDDVEGMLDWAGATAALVVLSHDPHVDAPVLAAGLSRSIPYIGAMGSRSTQSRRLERLAAMGVEEEQLRRIHRPIGLNLGGRRAPEVALAIVAEILAVHCGRDAKPLTETVGSIHG
jgi:xanthine dehydrogenase accessory factor